MADELFYCSSSSEDDVIPISRVMDLIPDCLNAADEFMAIEPQVSCLSPQEIPCVPFHTKCFPFKGLCTYDHDQHGHLRYCRNGAHLLHCSPVLCPTRFKCPFSYCVPVKKLCDHVKDCPNGEDERGCEKSVCPSMCSCFGLSIMCQGNISNLQLYLYKALYMFNMVNSLPSLNSCDTLLFMGLYKSRIEVLQPYSFVGCSDVQYLDLVKTGVRIVKSYAFQGLANLRHFFIQDHDLKQIEPFAFHGVSLLSELSLAGNRVAILHTSALHSMTSLEVINISNNLLTKFNFGLLSQLPRVQEVDISHNPLVSSTASNGFPKARITLQTSNESLCCHSELFLCHYNYTWSLCTQPVNYKIKWVFGCYSATIIIGNALALWMKVYHLKGTRNVVSAGQYILFLSDAMQGFYIIMDMVKDIIFPGHFIYRRVGDKHIWCIVTSVLQLCTSLLPAAMKAQLAIDLYIKSRHIEAGRKSCINTRYIPQVSVSVALTALCSVYAPSVDPYPSCSLLNLRINTNIGWMGPFIMAILVHNIGCHAVTICLASLLSRKLIRSRASVIAAGGRSVAGHIQIDKGYLRLSSRAMVGLVTDLICFGVVAWQVITYHHLNTMVAVVISLAVFPLPAAINPIVSLVSVNPPTV